MTLRLFLPGEVIVALLWISFLGAYRNYTLIVIFCVDSCFICLINKPIRSFFTIYVHHQIYRTFLVDPANGQQKQMLRRAAGRV